MQARNKVESKTVEQKNKAKTSATVKQSEERAHSQELSEGINLSSKPFPHGEARSQPCVSRLSPLAVPVLRGADPQPSQIPDAKANPVQSEERQFAIDAILSLRKDVTKSLTVLTRCDNGISVELAQKICNVINEIDRAEVPT